MLISNFTHNDIATATQLTISTWGKELSLANKNLEKVLYEAMVRYYYRSQEYSYKLVDPQSQSIHGFLLAAPIETPDNSHNWLKYALSHFKPEEQDLVYGYLRYLSYNGNKVRQIANKNLASHNQLVLYLFLSNMLGVGSALLQNLEEIAKTHDIRQLYLWADSTCDYDYYQRRGYQQIGYFVNKVLPMLGPQETWVYRKNIW